MTHYAEDADQGAENQAVRFILNGNQVNLDNVSPHALLIDYLHQADVGLTGTKLVCGEAGCGACTVMETSWDPEAQRFIKRAINSCIRPLASVDGMMITTTEGIGSTRHELDEVQYALAAHNGSQCGFCSAGFVMNMYTLRQNRNGELTEREIEQNFDGHICRCTGYRPILDAFKTFAEDYQPPANAAPIEIAGDERPKVRAFTESPKPPAAFEPYMKEPHAINLTNGYQTFLRAPSLAVLTAILQDKTYLEGGVRLVSGNTSTGIYKTVPIYNEPATNPSTLIDISRIAPLQTIDVYMQDTGPSLKIGAGVTLNQLIEEIEQIVSHHPSDQVRGLAALLKHLKIIANHQVRAVATVGGNLAMATNDGFPSDLIVVLAALDAKVTVMMPRGAAPEASPIYPVLDLPKRDVHQEPIVYLLVSIPGTAPDVYVTSHKVRARPDNAHAIVNNALHARIVDGKASDVRLVFNGLKTETEGDAVRSVSGNPWFEAVRMPKTEAALTGNLWNDETLQQALDVLEHEVDSLAPKGLPPIEHVPWSYRRSLALSLFFKSFVEIAEQVGTVEIKPRERSAAWPIERGVSGGQQSYNDYPELLPVSAPLVKLSAFMQTAGEAAYTQTIEPPLPTWEAAYVYSTLPSGSFHFKNIEGEKVSPKTVFEDMRRQGFDKLLGIVTYDDVPNKEGNWAGLGGDEPIFVPHEESEIPPTILAAAAHEKTFQPHLFTSCGAPLALVFAEDRTAARELAAFIRYNHIQETASEDPILTLDEAIQRKSLYTNNPPTNPSMTHIDMITRPGSNEAWLKDPSKPMKGCTVISGTHRTGAQNHFYLETQTTLAVPGEQGAMVLHASTQNLADNQYGAARALGVPANKVAVNLIRLGGGFGGKQMRTSFTSTAAAVAAAALGRPVRLMLDRNANLIMQGNRHPFLADYHVAHDQDGRIHGLKVDFKSDGGCTYDISFSVMDFVQLLADNVYDIPTWRTSGNVYRTNKISSTAYRGFGIIQCMNIIEGIIAQVAHAVGQPIETVRGRNLYRRGRPVSGPFKLSAQTLSAIETTGLLSKDERKSLRGLKDIVHDTETAFRDAIQSHLSLSPAQMLMLVDLASEAHGFTPYMQALDRFDIDTSYQELVRAPDYAARVAAVDAFNRANRWKKRGIYAMPLKYGNAFTGPRGALNQGGAYVLAYAEDGSVLVRHGGVELGQGLQTQMAQIAAETLGIPLDKIRMGSTTTEVIGDAAPTAASTASDLNGGAVDMACRTLRERLEDFCRTLEQYAFRDIQKNETPAEAGYKAMVEAVVGNWRTRWAECWDMVVSLANTNRLNLAASARYAVPDFAAVDNRHPLGSPFLYHLYSAAVSEVEIDVLTGEWNFVRADIRGDIGKSLNPLLDVGQMEGAFIQGLGYLTTEEMLWQLPGQAAIEGFPTGALTTYGTWTYKPPTINSIPEDFRVSIVNNEQSDAAGMDEQGPKPANSGVKSSKGASEFALVLANSAFYALHAAVMAARKDAGLEDWVDIEAPATVARIQMACATDRRQFRLSS